MPIIQRRVFFGKAGTAEQLVEHLQEGGKALQQYGVSFKSRLLTDYMSGRSDRVAVEWEITDLQEMEEGLTKAMANPQAQAFFKTWEGKLTELINYSKVENWTLRS